MQIQVTKTDCIKIANKVKQGGGVNNTELEVALAKKCLSLYEKLGEINNERNTFFKAIYSASVKFNKATSGSLAHKRAADLARQVKLNLKQAEKADNELKGIINDHSNPQTNIPDTPRP